jgi:hypothetical protein
MAAGAPSLLLRALALASTLPILKLYALLAMDSNPAFSPPAQMRRGRPAAEAPPAYVFPCIHVDLQENFSGSRIQIDNPCALLPG